MLTYDNAASAVHFEALQASAKGAVLALYWHLLAYQHLPEGVEAFDLTVQAVYLPLADSVQVVAQLWQNDVAVMEFGL